MNACPTCKERLKCFAPKLSEQDYTQLQKSVKQKTMAKGQTIYYENKPANKMYILLSGSVKLEHQNAFQRPIIMRIVHPGEYFGLGALVPNKKYIMTATTLSEADYCEFTSPAINLLCKIGTGFCTTMLEELYQQKTKIFEHSILLLTATYSARLAATLLLLGNKQHNITITKTEIAGMTGLARETISRMLRKLNAQKIIKLHLRHIEIINPRTLQKLAEEKKPRNTEDE